MHGFINLFTVKRRKYRALKRETQQIQIAWLLVNYPTIQHRNQLPTEMLGNLHCKPITFKKSVRKGIIELNQKEVQCAGNHRKV